MTDHYKGGVRLKDINEYLYSVVSKCPYPITYLLEAPNVINRWLVKRRLMEDCPDNVTVPRLSTKARVLKSNEIAFLSKDELEKNWRYYISEEKDSVYNQIFPESLFEANHDCNTYSLSCVYCKKQTDALIYIFHFEPMKIWINGQLVMMENFDYATSRKLFSYSFSEGTNTILVERTALREQKARGISYQPYTISIRPAETLNTEEYREAIDEDLLDNLDRTYQISLDNAFYLSGQDIGFVVFPNYFKSSREEVIISIFDEAGIKVCLAKAYTAEKISLSINKEVNGVLYLQVESTDGKKLSGVYLFRGDFACDKDRLFSHATKKGCSNELINNMQRLADVPSVCSSCNEFSQAHIYSSVMKNYLEFKKYVYSKNSMRKVTWLNIFKDTAMLFKNSQIDDGFIACRVFFPKEYNKKKKYPLVISVQFGYAMSRYPRVNGYIEDQRFNESIVICISGRGGLNKDYINEVDGINFINELISELNVDKDRVYGIGACTGALKLLGIAFKVPGMFTAVSSVSGNIRLDLDNPQYHYLDNIENLMVYNLFDTEDRMFNGSRVIDTFRRMKNHRNWIYRGFTHEEFDEFMNSRKVMKELISYKREKYPRTLKFNVCEPIFNTSYWIRVDRIEDLLKEAFIEARLESKDLIEIETRNISNFSFLIDLKGMRIERRLEVKINGVSRQLKLKGYSRIFAFIKDEGIDLKVVDLSLEEFNNEYNFVNIDQSLMGIKQVYFKRCNIIKQDACDKSKKLFDKRLVHSLCQPLKERTRNYKYDLIKENEATGEKLSEANFVFVANIKNMYPVAKEAANSLDIKFESDGITFRGEEYSGDYFAFVRRKNPYNSDRQMLAIVYNSDSVEGELINFLSMFDSNPIFYSDTIIYCNGRYLSFRE